MMDHDGENPTASRPAPSAPAAALDLQELKGRVRERLLDQLNFTAMAAVDHDVLRGQLAILIMQNLEELEVPLNVAELGHFVRDIQNEILGLGPLESLLEDSAVCDILVNTYRQVYVERAGRLELTPVRFRDNTHLREVIEKIVARVGRRIDESSPMVDARLTDGSRVNAIIPPLAVDGPILSIRKFNKNMLGLEDLVGMHALTKPMGELLKAIVRVRLSTVISGGTGSGKTTLLNILSGFIPANERIITIEDSAELQLRQEHVVRLETRIANVEGKGEVTQRDLVRNSLRMRPDRIILGEVRAAEALDMLQAMNTGHDGSLATVHANSPRDAVARIETMVAMASLNLPPHAIRQQIASALDVVVQVQRLADGKRKVMSIQEVAGLDGDSVLLQEVFTFEQTGLDPQGKVKGRFRATGVRPKFMEKLQAAGMTVHPKLFDPANVEEC